MSFSVFFQFELPNHATWFVLSLFAAFAIFYQFGRPLALRNFDLVGLFLFAPGLLILDEAQRLLNLGEVARAQKIRVIGYGSLLGACLFSFVRCLFDLSAVKRARISPNLTVAGMVWLGAALLAGLGAGTTYYMEPNAEESAAVEAHGARSPGSRPVLEVDASRQLARTVIAVASQVAVVILLVLICRIHFQDPPASAGTALLYLMLPSTAYHFDQSNHVWPTAFLLGSILAYKKPAVAGGLLGGAAGTALFPLFLFPVWFQFYRGRGGMQFVRWFGLVGVLVFALTFTALTILGDITAGLWQTPHLSDWQPWRVPTAPSVWTGGHWAYRLPIFVAFLGLSLGAFVWHVVRNLGQLIAMTAAVVIGMQFWLADGGGVYVTWFSPLLLLLAFRPTTVDLQPPVVPPGSGWLSTVWRRFTAGNQSSAAAVADPTPSARPVA